ncbi:hypothetical protein BRC19_03170 [Candidatus Saccharibacteria bacterium QS_5_54_17]|nr:MAG: hypothetical protein BRC19_03170 [Candidatus Saccharibacteria bacterium QS_5_54_17]
MRYTRAQLDDFKRGVDEAEHVALVQPERIDADSLGSSLGLESALTDLNKTVTMFCYDDVPPYLQHLPGWDRVTNQLPGTYDMAIVVDSATLSQLEKTWAQYKGTIMNRPLYCIDHHRSTAGQLEGDNVGLLVDEEAGASAQQIVELAREFDWYIDAEAAYSLAAGIKADTVNLSTKKTTSRTFSAMGYLVDRGADLELLRYNIEQSNSLDPESLPLKATALQRTRFFKDNRIAITYFTREEYNSLGDDQLVIERMKHDLRALSGVDISVTITERNGYSNASMRANLDVAGKTADHFGGGGHDRAASCRFPDVGHEEVIEEIVPVISGYIDEQDRADVAAAQ